MKQRINIARIFKPTHLALVFLFIFSFCFFNSSTSHASYWNAGKIIDDGVFTNKNTMAVWQIQSFLNSKNPDCDPNGTQPSEYGGGTRAQYAASRGEPVPFTCLKDYVEGGRSAAQIIYDTAQQHRINPQVLIVLLQKEQGLVTDEWPFRIQYKTATGYGCPDTAPCDQQYYGLSNQLYWSGYMFRAIMDDNPNWYTPYVLGNNYIQYNPQASCGGSNVYIQNRSTQALYNYTPYQPNEAAINAPMGTTVPCGAYGNKNFWLYFTSWFGSTLGIPRDGSIDAAWNTSGWLEYGESKHVSVVARNTGTETWCADGSCPSGKRPTRLVAQNYSPFWLYHPGDTNWVNNAQIKMQTPSVPPGETGVFSFYLKAPNAKIAVSNRFYVVIAGVTAPPSANVWIGGNVYPTKMQLVSKTITDSSLLPNQQATATVTIKNTSKITWYNEASHGPNNKPMRLFVPGYAATPFRDPNDTRWVSPSQVAMQTSTVAPGQNAVFQFSLRGPYKKYAPHNFKLLPVIDGKAVYPDIGIVIPLTVPQPQLTYSYVSSIPPPATMTPGVIAPQNVSITLRNTGNTIWRNETAGGLNRTRLMMSNPKYRSSPFYNSADPKWLTASQIAMQTPVVSPGQDGTFVFSWKAPSTPKNYLEYFTLVADGGGFFPEYGSAFRTNVN